MDTTKKTRATGPAAGASHRSRARGESFSATPALGHEQSVDSAGPVRPIKGIRGTKANVQCFVEIVQRHAKVDAKALKLIRRDFAAMIAGIGTDTGGKRAQIAEWDEVLTTQVAADLVGVSRPFLVARIDAGDIPLHQTVGNQRRVLKSAVLAWQQRAGVVQRSALRALSEDLDQEIFG